MDTSIFNVYLENTGESGGVTHSKFYQLEVRYNGKTYEIYTQWGPIGQIGQYKLHSSYYERYTAISAAESIADSKKAKGYIARQNKSVGSVKMKPTTKNQAVDIRLGRFSFDEE